MSGPVRQVLDMAAINEPVRTQLSKGKAKVTASLGVFQPGRLWVAVVDADGRPLGQPSENPWGRRRS
jgi:hypothetical protein